MPRIACALTQAGWFTHIEVILYAAEVADGSREERWSELDSNCSAKRQLADNDSNILLIAGVVSSTLSDFIEIVRYYDVFMT